MKEVITFLDKYLNDNDIVVCATSGGVDSMTLLNILVNYNKNIKIICAHVNHNFREESYEEYEFVKEFCNNNNIIFEGIVFEKGIEKNIEAKFRDKRYKFFNDIILKYNAKYLFTAHHGDDLIETILMRITRGSNLDGYYGFNKIVERENYTILRPLIYLSKDDIYKYALANKIDYREDKTNESDNYTRNRYRKYVLPSLKKENKNIHRKFLKFSEELNMANNFIDKYIINLINNNYKDNKLKLDFVEVEEDFILRKILYEVTKEIYKEDVKLLRDNNIEELIKIIKSKKPNLTIDLPLGLVAIKKYNYLEFTFKKKLLDYNIELNKKEIAVPFGVIKFVNETELTDNYVCHINSKDIKLPLYVRNRKDGDYIEVLGLNGKRKIKDIFIDEKIPKTKRDVYPIVVDGNDKVIWIPGVKKSKYNSLKTKKYDIILWYTKEENNE